MPLVLKLRLGGLRNGAFENPEIARRIDRAQKPLLVSDISEVSLGNILSMSHLLEPKVRLQLVLLDPEARRRSLLFDQENGTQAPSF